MSNGLGYILADVLDIFGYGGAHLAAGALGLDLLYGESDGLGIDFTDHDKTVGRMQVKDTTTAANIFTGAPIDKLTYASPSVKMCVQSDGTIKHASHNLFSQTDDITDASSWTANNFPQGSEGFGTDFYGTFEGKPAGNPADGITLVFTGQYDSFHSEGTRTQTVTGVTYRVYADIYNNGMTTTNLTGLDVQGAQFVALSSALADGEWTNDVYWEFTATTTGNNQIGWQDRNTSGFGTLTFRNVRMLKWPAVTTALPATGTSNEYQLPYSWKLGDDRVTYESRGWHSEEARTNLQKHSVTIDNSPAVAPWVETNAVVPVATTDPGGGNSAWVLEDANASAHAQLQGSSFTTADSTQYCWSCFVKKDSTASTTRFLLMRGLCVGGTNVNFDVNLDTSDGRLGIEGTAADDYGIIDYGDWWRIWITGTNNATSNTAGLIELYPAIGAAATPGTAGHAVSTQGSATFAWPQVEQAAFPSSPILTGSASATRAVDKVNLATSAFPYSDTLGTLYVKGTPVGEDSTATPATFCVPLWLNAATSGANQWGIERVGTVGENNEMIGYVRAGGADQAILQDVGSVTKGSTFKAALGVQLNTMNFALNGIASTEDTSATFPTSIDNLTFGWRPDQGTYRSDMFIEEALYVPRRMTDAELVTLTSPTVEQGAQLLAFGEGDGLFLDFTYDFETNSYGATTGDAIIRDKTGILAAARNQPYDILTYTSPSPKMALQDDGNLLYGPHNLLPKSADTAGTWTKTSKMTITDEVFVAPNGAVEADGLKSNNAGADTHEMYYIPYTTTTGVTYGIQTYMKADTGNPHDWVQMAVGPPAQFGDSGWCNYDLVNGVIGNSGGNNKRTFMEPVGDGWYRCGLETVAESGAASQGYLIALKDDDTTTRNPNSTVASGREIQVWGHTLYKAPMKALQIPTSGAARYELPYEWDTGGTSLGVLPEEARTNDMTYSLNMGGAAELGNWQVDNASFTDAAAVSPSGLTDAVKLVEDTSSNNHQVRFTKTGEAINQVVSVYAKAGERSIIEMQLSDFVFSLKTRFDLSDGTIDNAAGNGGNWTNVTNTITSVGNGWYRCSIRADNSVAAATDYFWVTLWTTTTNYAGDGTSGCYLYGGQWEEGTHPTSLIETGSATATRAVDDINLALSATTLPDMTGATDATSGYVEYVIDTSLTGFRHFLEVSDASTNNRYIARVENDAPQVAIATNDTGGAAVSMTGTAESDGATGKIAFRAVEDNYAASYSTGTQDTDTDADNMGAAMTVIRIGAQDNGDLTLSNMPIKKISIVPRAKANAELEDDVGN